MKKVCCVFFIFSLLFFSPAWSELLSFDLKLTNGYRSDSLNTQRKFLKAYESSFSNDQLKLRSISLYQVGFKANLCLLSLFVHLDADYAWAGSGGWKEIQHLYSQQHARFESSKLKGMTKDAILGVGYQFNLIPFYRLITLRPMLGWSYHEQHFKTSHLKARINDVSKTANLGYSNHWEGPWAGINLKGFLDEFSIDLGYEYHWGNWQSKKNIHGLQALKDQLARKGWSKHTHGQVFYIDATWHFNLCWYIGLGLKLQEWKVAQEKLKSPNESVLNEKSHHTAWQSFAATIDIGFGI
ncbi:Uncharacterized protein PRO82_000138 [Candidatus Protochlamydia amoebophila]|uniref:hypothetical protein n=1 Tax=Candidatus Protochlamydia amoebophila TaxID=362787 RepID=UPI001BC9B882|nr:hypothetical protein [Candidatus Protochlamydia amoebophila]MBS4162861.1 Uncharacterized protein [Candidatus Protochlamydia amoebophila]